jgi:TRAP-type transport system small permease protein
MRRLLQFYHLFLVGLLGLLTVFLVIPVGMQVLARHGEIVPNYLWTEEISRFALIWLVMIGSAVAVRENTNFDIDLLPTPATPLGTLIARMIVRVCVLVFGLVFLWGSVEYTQFGLRMTSDMSDINMGYVYGAFPFAAIGWIVFTLEGIYDAIAAYRRSETALALMEVENGTR